MPFPEQAPAGAEEGLPLLRIERAVVTRGHGAFRLGIERFFLRAGEIVALTGPSGSGKSTFLDFVGLAQSPESAARFEIVGTDGPVDAAGLWRRGDRAGLGALRARELGYMLQTGGLLPFLSARANIALPRRIVGLAARDPWIEALAEELGIAGVLDRKGHRLSVGQRQRVALLRALAHRPRLLLADEPTAALDPMTADIVFGKLVDLAAKLGIAAIVVSHDVERVRAFGLPELRILTEGDAAAPRGRLAWPAVAEAVR